MMSTHRMRRRPAGAALALLLAAAPLLPACGGSPPTHRTVTVTTFNVVWSDPVSSSQVASDWETSMEAIGADGSTVHPGTATGPGTWAIAGVPVGPYTLHVTWINGLNLYFQSSADPLAIQAGVGTEPVVAWAAPAVGAPTSVQVGIRELDPVGTRYMTTPIASFVTTGSSVKIPAGLLQAGRWYVAVLTTVWSP